MSDVEHSLWQRAREEVLDFVWRDVYTRWYLVFTIVWWAAAMYAIASRWSHLSIVAGVVGWFGQWVAGKVVDLLERWHKSECNCPTCQEQKTGGAA